MKCLRPETCTGHQNITEENGGKFWGGGHLTTAVGGRGGGVGWSGVLGHVLQYMYYLTMFYRNGTVTYTSLTAALNLWNRRH